jgi:hypothetical protein
MGYALWGIGMPYLIDYWLGPRWGVLAAILFAVSGIVLLIAAHTHREKGAPRSKSGTAGKYILIGGVIGLGLIGVMNVLRNRAARTEAGSTPTVEQGLAVTFKMLFINMSRRLDVAPFWALYSSSYGQTASPIALLAFIEVTNRYPHPITISGYSMMFESSGCNWMKLPAMNSNMFQLLFGYNGLADTKVFKTDNSLNTLWKLPLTPFIAQDGFLTFDSSSACKVEWGDYVHVQMSITDSTGISYPPFMSPELTVARNFPMSEIAGEVTRPALQIAGYGLDISNAKRRIFSDEIHTVPSEELNKGTVTSTTQGGRDVLIGLADGAYMCGCVRPSNTRTAPPYDDK